MRFMVHGIRVYHETGRRMRHASPKLQERRYIECSTDVIIYNITSLDISRLFRL